MLNVVSIRMNIEIYCWLNFVLSFSLQKRVSRFHEELESVMSLMPIASSPLDKDVPLSRAMESTTSPITEMEQGRTSSVEFLDHDPHDLEEDEGPVKLLGEAEEVEEIFPLQEDLDLEQIETN